MEVVAVGQWHCSTAANDLLHTRLVIGLPHLGSIRPRGKRRHERVMIAPHHRVCDRPYPQVSPLAVRRVARKREPLGGLAVAAGGQPEREVPHDHVVMAVADEHHGESIEHGKEEPCCPRIGDVCMAEVTVGEDQLLLRAPY